MQAKNINKLINDLYKDKTVIKEFKNNPEKIKERYKVSNDVIEAIKKNDIEVLLKNGMNPVLVEGPTFSLIEKIGFLFKRICFALLFGFSILGISTGRVFAVSSTKSRKDAGLMRASKRLISTYRKQEYNPNLLRVIRSFMRKSFDLARKRNGVLRNLRSKRASLRSIRRHDHMYRNLIGRYRSLRRIIERCCKTRRAENVEVDNKEIIKHPSIKILDPIE